MKISSTGMQLASAHASVQQHEVTESLRVWADRRRAAAAEQQGPTQTRPADSINISDAARQAGSSEATALAADDELSSDPRLMLLRAILRRLIGVDVEVFDTRDLKQEAPAADLPQAPVPQQSAPAPAAPAAGWGLQYDRHESYTETEQTSFSASGTVQTADGREISFSLELSMSRSYHEESDVRLRLGDAARQQKDPLVVNFSGNAAQLLDQRFSFDLNADGTAESINRLASGSGFLVFDRNGDGRASDGSELFGTKSGDGFADLAALDNDGNGWIDEGDSAYTVLRVWTPDAEGGGALQTLQETGVGAISLSRITTPFQLKDAANATLGEVRSTGIYLREDGGAGTVQQVDLSV